MNMTVKAGIVLGLLEAIWMFLMGLTGMYKHPILALAFLVVIPIHIGVLIWALRKTATSNGYGAQVWAGVLISIVGAVLIFGASLLLTKVLVPTYVDDLLGMQQQMLQQMNLSEEQIAKMMADAKMRLTPTSQAFQGVIGTVVVGLVISLIAAIWLRRKPALPAV